MRGIVFFLMGIIMCSCQHVKHQEVQEEKAAITFPDTTQLERLDGKQLAYTYCQLCHAFPDPALLTKNIWKEKVLPVMAQRLGIHGNISPYHGLSYYEIHVVTQAGIFPAEQKISEASWQKIVQYFVDNAPDSMPAPTKHEEISATLPFFKPEAVDMEKGLPPLTTLVKFDSVNSKIWIGTARNSLEILDQNLQVTDSLITESPPVAVVNQGDITSLLEVGILNPSDERKGEFWQLDKMKKKQILIRELARPVHVSIADLDEDRHPDYIISNFGYRLGHLSWYGTNQSPNLQEHVLSQDPGARKTIIYDFNRDRRPDIAALMTQGDERIIIFYNQGKGNFTPETVLRFPPVYGSSDFELNDFNQDGKMDILYVNGDNADYSFALKNYHGIRIFENQGDDHFKEKYFFPMNGATMAKAIDFDLDGDLDIAAIAHFADFKHTPEKGFIYLENTSKNTYQFKGYTTPEAKEGRWLTFDTGDIDQDGDEDIILGSFIYTSTPIPLGLQQEWMQHGPAVMVLKNLLR